MFNKLSAIAEKFLPVSLKTIYKAGFVDKEMKLTPAGIAELEAILFEENMDKLVERASAKLEKSKSKK